MAELRILVRHPVLAGLTAYRAVVVAVRTEADVQLRLAKKAVFFAVAVVF